MSSTNIPPHDRKDDELEELFSALSDCVESLSLVAELFDRCFGRAQPDPLRGMGDPRSAETQPLYSVSDAEKISSRLRKLAHNLSVTPALPPRGLLKRLAPEIVSLIVCGYSSDEVVTTLSELGASLPVSARTARSARVIPFPRQFHHHQPGDRHDP